MTPQNSSKLQTARRRFVDLVIGRDYSSRLAKVDQIAEQTTVLGAKITDLGTENSYLFQKYLCPDKYEEYLVDLYKAVLGKRCDIKNPQTFSEKMQWLKLYDNTPEKTTLSDKYLVRDFIAKTIGKQYLIPLLGVYDTFEDIDFSKLPNEFIIKTNHNSGGNIIVRDKSKLDLADAKNRLNYWLDHNQAYWWGLELHYKNIQPKIIIEELLEFPKGIEDYKFYCFDRKPAYLLVIADRRTEEKMAFYDMNFKKQKFTILEGMKDLNIKKPPQFDEMLELTHKLCNKLDYPVERFDFYVDKQGRVYFGEITFAPGSGYYEFSPKKYDKIWGDMIALPKKKRALP